ncbi:MAG: chromate transporter [Firmicutes bacterium]|nr:chromate transporter [Bacillota bacterium]
MQKTILWELFITFFKIGAFTFGGGYAMLPLIQKEVVDQKNWLSEEDFSNVLAVTQSAPGALAVNASVFIGYNLAGFPGAMVSVLGTTLPSFLVILIIAAFFTQFSSLPVVQSMFNGIRPAVVALIAYAVVKLGKNILVNRFAYIIAAAVLLLNLLLGLSPIQNIMMAALAGVAYHLYHQ